MRFTSTGTPEERFWAKVVKGPSCWEWTANKTRSGYGQFRISTTDRTKAHRFAYELLVAPIPSGLEIDHLCRNRGCVNPSHLEVVTHAENMRRTTGIKRGPYSLGDTCKAGHPRTPANTGTNRRGARFCKPCQRAAQAKFRAAS